LVIFNQENIGTIAHQFTPLVIVPLCHIFTL